MRVQHKRVRVPANGCTAAALCQLGGHECARWLINQMRIDIDASHMRAGRSPPQLLAPRSVCPAVDARLERNTEFRPSFIHLTIAAFERS